jgi:hypothetical protein
MVQLLATISIIAALFGAAISFVGALLFIFFKHRIAPLQENLAEQRFLYASLLAAIFACLVLIVFPFYSGNTATLSADSYGNESYEAADTSSTLIEANGAKVAILFVLPVVFSAIPFLFSRLRMRPTIEGLCALFIGGQVAMGMSGYGIFFVFSPSALFMVIAGILALSSSKKAV